jgi:multicomponent Na+:H+ antiporter subunit F
VSTLLVILSLGVGISVAATLLTVVTRPGVFDRIIGVGVVGTKATILLALAGALFGRLDAYVDLALTYALLNFVGTLAVAKYFERRVSQS